MSRSSIHRAIPPATLLFLLGSALYSCAPSSPEAAPTASNAEKIAKPTQPSVAAVAGAAKVYAPDAVPAVGGFNRYGFEKPKNVQGIYLTAWSAGSPTKMEKVMKLLDNTELNSVVIDVRDTGEMYFKTGIALAKASPPDQIAVPKPDRLFARLRKHNVWPIARVACFRDNFLPKMRKDLAVQTPSGATWRDRSGHAWLDPYAKENWDYIAQTVEYAMDIGFPEIQLDYVRFPSEGKSNTQVFPNKGKYADPKAKPWDVVGAFCEYVREKVKSRGATFSADIFGIISSSKRDQGIGQDLETIAKPFDILSPMVYPSHFAKGEYGIKNPDLAPYEIITKSLGDYKRRVPKKEIRPWLQDFSLGNHYGPEQVKAQIKAARALGYNEYLLWNAGNRYTEGAFAKEKPAKPQGPAGPTPATTPSPKPAG